jgi:hypothetical protein
MRRLWSSQSIRIYVVSGVTTYSCGPKAIIMCGIPAGRQRAVEMRPSPPLL